MRDSILNEMLRICSLISGASARRVSRTNASPSSMKTAQTAQTATPDTLSYKNRCYPVSYQTVSIAQSKQPFLKLPSIHSAKNEYTLFIYWLP